MRKITIFLLFFFSLLSIAKGERMLFSHYTTEQGLSSNTVNGITQDQYGFIWLATNYGVSRFDGSVFNNFRPADYEAMRRNDLYEAFILPNGKPTFASSNSVLFSYEERNASFKEVTNFITDTTYKYDIKGFSVQSNGEGLLSTAYGVYRYDIQDDQFKLILPELSARYVLDVRRDTFGRYWVCDYNGAYVVDEQGRILPGGDFSSLRETINGIFELDAHHLLLRSTVGSLWMVRLTQATEIEAPQQLETPFNYVSSIVKDKHGTIWMGTLGDGLWRAEFHNDLFQFTPITPFNAEKDAFSKIASLFVDKENHLWIATQGSGIWRSNTLTDYSYIFSHSMGVPTSVGASFFETKRGDILMGTDGSGLILMDSLMQVKRTYQQSDGLSSNNVLTILPDGEEFILGYWGGETNQFSLQNGNKQIIQYQGIEKPIFTTKNITRTQDGTLYVTTAGDGVYYQKDNSWHRLVLEDSILNNYRDRWMEYFYQKNDGTIYIISSRTIWSNQSGEYKALVPDIDQSRSYDPLSFTHCVSDPQGNLYVTSDKGVYHITPDDQSCQLIDYVPQGEYQSILIDRQGLLWTSGSNGIVVIDPQKKTYRIFLSEKEIPSKDYFVAHAAMYSPKSGRMFFGTNDGFVSLFPDQVSKMQIDHLSFSQFLIRGEQIEEGTKILPKSLNETPTLSLGYDQTHCTIRFDWIDYSLTNKSRVRYRIPQLDTVWIDLGEKREINIAYLPTGKFTVELNAYSPNTENSQTIQLQLHVSPPWWKTTTFHLFVILLVGSMLYILYYIRIRRMKEHRERLQMMVANRTKELNEANEQLQAQKVEIEERNASLLSTLRQKDQLVSVIAHDLKNPMFAIVTTLKRLLNRVYTPVEQQQVLQELTEESENLQSQMIHLLHWATDKESQLDYLPRAIDLPKMIDETILLMKGLATEKHIKWVRHEKMIYQTWADPRMIATILRNLITNAIKFTFSGKSITLSLSETESHSIFTIQDEGMGMNQEKIDELLAGGNINSTAGTEKEQGFGLGFRIILDFIQRNNGTIEIESELGQGTSITITLPKHTEKRKVEQESIKQEKVTIQINRQMLEGKTLLVVDDDHLLLNHITDLLSPYVQVLQAHDGEEGVQVAQSQVPDLIISDVDMPKKNGIEMYEQLRDQLMTSNIPLLFLSAKNDDAVRLKGLSVGAIDYIAKPFDDEELLVKICNFLTWQQKQQIKALAQSYEEGEVPQTPEVNPLLEELLELIKANYTNPLYSVNDIAMSLHMSKSTMSRRFKSIMDKTPMEVLAEYRLNIAKKLLEEGKPVGEVAYAVGFNDPAYFSRRYKEVFGNSPKSGR